MEEEVERKSQAIMEDKAKQRLMDMTGALHSGSKHQLWVPT